VEIDRLVLHAALQPLDENVVEHPLTAVHAYRDLGGCQALDELLSLAHKAVLRPPLEPKQLHLGRVRPALRCRQAGVRPSMGSVGDCYDNGIAESFFAILESEPLDRQRFQTPD